MADPTLHDFPDAYESKILDPKTGWGGTNLQFTGPMLAALHGDLLNAWRWALAVGKTVANRTALQALTIADLATAVGATGGRGHLWCTVLSDNDSKPRTYRWLPADTTAASEYVIAPTGGGVGRWHAIIDDVRDVITAAMAGTGHRTILMPVVGADRVTNLGVETAHTSVHALAANALVAKDVLDLDILWQIPAVVAGHTLALAVRLGGVAGTPAVQIPAAVYQANDWVCLTAKLDFAVIGGAGRFHVDATVERSLLGFVEVLKVPVTFDNALDTTAACDVTPTALWSAANAGDRVDIRKMDVRVTPA